MQQSGLGRLAEHREEFVAFAHRVPVRVAFRAERLVRLAQGPEANRERVAVALARPVVGWHAPRTVPVGVRGPEHAAAPAPDAVVADLGADEDGSVVEEGQAARWLVEQLRLELEAEDVAPKGRLVQAVDATVCGSPSQE